MNSVINVVIPPCNCLVLLNEDRSDYYVGVKRSAAEMSERSKAEHLVHGVFRAIYCSPFNLQGNFEFSVYLHI